MANGTRWTRDELHGNTIRNVDLADSGRLPGSLDAAPTSRLSVSGDDILTIRDTAALLGIPVRTAYRLAGRDELPGARRLGRTVVVVRPVLERWLLNGDRDGLA